jgi:hypothetical protein
MEAGQTTNRHAQIIDRRTDSFGLMDKWIPGWLEKWGQRCRSSVGVDHRLASIIDRHASSEIISKKLRKTGWSRFLFLSPG